MPPAQMNHLFGWFEFDPTGEIDSNQSADVGHREVRSADEFVVGKPRVEPGEEIQHPSRPRSPSAGICS